MRAMYGTELIQKCKSRPQNDEHILIQLFGSNSLGLLPAHKASIKLDEGIVNIQHTRLFDGKTAFVYGGWWMSKN
jgi:hypothetical protein